MIISEPQQIYEPLILPEVGAEKASILNAYYRHNDPTLLDYLDGEIKCSTEPNDDRFLNPFYIKVGLEEPGISKTEIIVELPEEARELLMGQTQASLWREYHNKRKIKDRLDWLWDATVVVLLDQLNAEYGIKLTLIGEVKEKDIDAHAIALGFTMNANDQPSLPGRIWVTLPAFESFLQNRPLAPKPKALTVPVKLPVTVGRTHLSYGQLTDLATGDIVMMRSSPLEQNQLFLNIPHTRTFSCSIHEETQGKMTMSIENADPEEQFDDFDVDTMEGFDQLEEGEFVDEGFDSELPDDIEKKFNDSFDEIADENVEIEMSETDTSDAFEVSEYGEDIEQTEPTIQTNELPINLTFQLGHVEKTVAEISVLSAGQIVTLNADLNSPVSIFANGKRLGEGSLVKVQDKIGVQIITWGK